MNTSAVWNGQDRILLQTRPKPTAGPGDICVRVEASGICGTDVHVAAGEYPLARPGVVIGHEFAGTIVELGPGVASFALGDRVAIDPNIPCRTCQACHNARPHLCERPQGLGVSRDGGMTQFMVCPASQAYQVPAGLPIEAASLAEPLACALHAVDRAALRSGETALVLGAGPIGILCAALLVAAGAMRVFVSEPDATRRARVSLFGAEPLLPDAVPPGAADVVLECVGRAETMRASVEAVRPGGTVVWVGVAPPDVEVAINPYDLFRREITIRGTYTNPYTMDRALAVLNSGRIDWQAIITHRFPLKQFDAAWTAHCSGAGLKICLQPEASL